MRNFNEKRAIAAILYLVNKEGAMDLYALLKTLYYAEKYHLQQWGRTVTGDTYHRLQYGPVPSKMYDMLKSIRGDGFWPRDLSEILEFKDPRTVVAKVPSDLRRLSKTDIETLDRSFRERGHKSFKELCDEAHTDTAFKRSEARKMTDEDLVEDDPLLLEHLEEVREHDRLRDDWRFFPPFDEEAICCGETSEGPCSEDSDSRCTIP